MDITLYDLTAFLTGLMLWFTIMSLSLFVLTASWAGTVFLCRLLMFGIRKEE